MRRFRSNPIEMFSSFFRNYALLMSLVRQDIAEKYKGSMFGLLWMIIQPLLMLTIYTLVFGVIFQAKWGGGEDKVSFAFVVFLGLLLHGVIAEVLGRAPQLVLSNANYVTKILFPLEILAWVTSFSAIFHAVVGFGIWIAAYVLLQGKLTLMLFYSPLLFLAACLYALGFSWAVSAVGVYVRDLGQVTNLLSTVLLFLAPIFYPIDIVPESLRVFVELNPLTALAEQFRVIAIEGDQPDFLVLARSLASSFSIAWFGFWIFQRSRQGFADVL